jgi:hypothetical protein
VSDYLAAVVEEDWEQAYEQRCPQDQQAESLSAFTSRVSSQPRIESYEVGDLTLEQGAGGVFDAESTVAVRVTYTGGAGASLTFPVEQNPDTGDFQVCGTVTGR